ncbi:MAG: HAMP domain-containing protein [Proteobacteria bacterium]|nr:HAMP domain-containing protein [Pseudomonadota bacterium]MBU1138345.1 HAMP domain-containing protein [Pseudomonadota bacterium]MBU1418114.1 HAMP domain-containing protein [Pseudomonadota bacterium]MBU1453290.1 HAMP domain-containing protein [Pseudomonadota bacterium]
MDESTQDKVQLPATQSLSKPQLSDKQRQQKKRLVRKVILICLCLIPLFVWLESSLINVDITLPVSSDILIFGLINLNVLLVLLMLYLVLRNLAELFFESRQNVLGSKLKSKLVISFISLSLIPTILLFFVSLQFVSTSMDYWFNSNIELSLQKSLDLAKSIIQETKEEVDLLGKNIEQNILLMNEEDPGAEGLEKALNTILTSNNIRGPDSLTLIIDQRNKIITASSPLLSSLKLPKITLATLDSVRKNQEREIVIQESNAGELIRRVSLIRLGWNPAEEAFLVTTLLIENDQLDRLNFISKGIEDYQQLKYLKKPFKFWILIILLIVTLLIIFSAIWFGLYIARSITGPLDKMATATRRVAEGDLSFVLEKESNDEMGLLVDSFNTMTSRLSSSNAKLAEALHALQQSSRESEDRRRYTEIILQNVEAGVISLDDNGKITTINRFAEKLLNIDKKFFLGRKYAQVLAPEHVTIIESFIKELNITGKSSVRQHLKISVLKQTFSLLVTFTRLENEDGNPLGFVLVFDNLTKIEKMQRMAAWREVARRIAHEIKNPLTPIQLSAQRLRRRYPEILAEDNSIFDQCTHTIIKQVDELKRLVSEFSQFARMPKINQAPADILRMIDETLVLYQQAHGQIVFTVKSENDIPIFSFDVEQIKRCLINLLDNAVAVLPDGGRIDIILSLDEEEENIFIQVCDSGPGIVEEDKLRLFEPYFSTKKSGTGLGLAIVSTIVSDHSGYIRIQDNSPHGSIFTIELPLLAKSSKQTGN